jgi:hypothetical protein
MNRALERLALAAHRCSKTWAVFWQQHGADVAAAEPWDRPAYRRLVGRLLALVVAGDSDGAEPPGDGWPRPCPWEIDDLANGIVPVANRET